MIHTTELAIGTRLTKSIQATKRFELTVRAV